MLNVKMDMDPGEKLKALKKLRTDEFKKLQESEKEISRLNFLIEREEKKQLPMQRDR